MSANLKHSFEKNNNIHKFTDEIVFTLMCITSAHERLNFAGDKLNCHEKDFRSGLGNFIHRMGACK